MPGERYFAVRDRLSELLGWIGDLSREVALEDEPDRPLPLILLAEPSVSRSEALNARGAAGHRWQVVCSSGSYAACAAAARAGLGITVQSAHLPTAGLAPPRLAATLPELPDVQYVAVAARKLTPPAETLLQILKDTPIG